MKQHFEIIERVSFRRLVTDPNEKDGLHRTLQHMLLVNDLVREGPALISLDAEEPALASYIREDKDSETY